MVCKVTLNLAKTASHGRSPLAIGSKQNRRPSRWNAPQIIFNLCPRQLRQKFARIPDSFWVLPQTSGSGVSSRTVVRATAVKSPVFPQCSQSAGVIGRLYACVGTTRQPFGPRVLTRAAGTFCNPCLRAGPTDQWRPRAESNRRPTV